jgi:hypothetical protein
MTRFVPSAAVAIAAAVVAVIALASRGTTPTTASAATVLYASAAALERSGHSQELGPYSYLYQRTVERSRFVDPGGTTILRAIDETWVARNGSGRIYERVLNRASIGNLHLRLQTDQRLRVSTRPFSVGATSFSYRQLQQLPSDPRRLAAVVDRLAERTARAYKDPPSAARSTIALYILRSIALLPTPTPVRAAVYRVMANTHGIRLLGRRRDAVGRTGELLVTTLGPERSEIIINPATGRLLQVTRILMRRSPLLPGWRPGLISRDTYVEESVVGSTRARPR